MKENLKPCVYKLSKHHLNEVRWRTFCRTVRRVAESGEVKYLRYGAEVKARGNTPQVRLRRPETG